MQIEPPKNRPAKGLAMDKAHMPSQPSALRPFGRVHIVGIGGIGMSGIAEVMHVMGYQVQGSDQGQNANTKRLEEMGIEVMHGHAAAHVSEAAVVTISSAVGDDNPECRRRARGAYSGGAAR